VSRKELLMPWKTPKPARRRMRACLLGLLVAVAVMAFASSTWAESGCHDRGTQGPVTIAGR